MRTTQAVLVFLTAAFMAAASGGIARSAETEKESFGADMRSAKGPLGGGRGYTDMVARGDYRVGTRDELLRALKKAQTGEIVYIDDSAEIGENYTTTEFDVRRKSTRRVTKTEFRSLQGSHRCYVDDRLVTASAGIPNVELEAVEPFDLGDLRRFAPAMISGWTAEEPSMTREASLELARSESRKTIIKRLRAFMPGDAHRSLRASTTLTDEAMDLVLLPVWVCAVRWRRDREPIRLLVNGQTGRVAGSVPISWAKVAAILGAAIAVIGLSLVFGALL